MHHLNVDGRTGEEGRWRRPSFTLVRRRGPGEAASIDETVLQLLTSDRLDQEIAATLEIRRIT